MSPIARWEDSPEHEHDILFQYEGDGGTVVVARCLPDGPVNLVVDDEREAFVPLSSELIDGLADVLRRLSLSESVSTG